MPGPRLQIQGLSQSFGGRNVLSGIDMVVQPGEVVALVGPNGAGKTTLLRAILGDDARSEGTVLLDGRPMDERSAATRRDVAAVLDDMGWFPDITSAEHLDLLAKAFGNPDPEDLVDRVLDILRISHVADQVPDTLSSGQRRRLALATTLVRPFSLLLLDEPEQRLDVEGRAWLAGHLREVAAGGASVVMACHDETLREAAGARVVTVGEEA